MNNPLDVLKARGGGARWKALLDDGVARSALDREVSAGRVVKYSYGVYALPTVSQIHLNMLQACGVSACLTAARERGFWVLSAPEVPHISVNHSRHVAGFTVHRAPLPLSDLDVVIQVLRCAEELNSIAVTTSAIRQKRCSVAELNSRLAKRNDLRARKRIHRIDPHAESVLELVSRYHLENAGFIVTSQVYLPGMGRMDQCVNGVLAIELMGKEFHLTAKAFNEDLRRFNQYTIAGFPVLRVGYALVIHHPEEFIALVRRALGG